MYIGSTVASRPQSGEYNSMFVGIMALKLPSCHFISRDCHVVILDIKIILIGKRFWIFWYVAIACICTSARKDYTSAVNTYTVELDSLELLQRLQRKANECYISQVLSTTV